MVSFRVSVWNKEVCMNFGLIVVDGHTIGLSSLVVVDGGKGPS